MKPVRLTVQGFMPFRLYQHVDFTGLDLFAIVGPTGSGKSALLDAMTFALYGATPRLGLSGMEALISQNEQGASVSLEFEVRGQLHRVARSRGRKASQNALTFESWDAASERWNTQVKGKVAETNERIVEVVGLDFAAFTRAVLLPQGEFSAFLRGKSSDRQKLLGDLLNLGEVAQMATFARERGKTYGAHLDGIHRLLTGEYEGISAEVLAGWQAEQAAADTRSEALAEAREELNTTLQRLRELGKLSEAHGRARVSLQTHEVQTEGVRRGAAQASAARRVAGVLPLIGAAERGAEAARRAARAAEVYADELAAAGRAAETAGVRLNAAQAGVDRLPEQEERAQALREAEALAVRLRLVGGRPDATHAQPLPWNEEAHAQAAASAERQKKNALERAKLEAERAALERRKLDFQIEEVVQKRELAELEKIKRDGMTVKAAVEAGRAELESAVQRAGVQAHRHLLHSGEPCPLCEQTVLAVPAERGEQAAGIAALKDAVGRQELSLEGLRNRGNELIGNTRARSRILEGAEEKLREEEAHLASRETDLHVAEDALKSALTGDPLMGDPVDLAARYLAGLAGQLRLVGRNPAADLQKLLAQMAEIRRTHDEARTAQAQAGAAHAAAAAAHAGALSQVAERETEAQQAAETLAAALAVLGLSAEQAAAAALPEAEIARLEAAAARHEQTRQRLSVELGELERKLGAQSFDPSRLSTAERDLAGLDAEIRSAQQASGQLAQKLLTGRERLTRKEALTAEAAEVARSLDIWKTLSSALGVSAFQQYLLQEVESRLLQGAGQLLLDISDGRYRLALEDGDYVVQDLWNAGETRAVRTLSGGETFLASLSLAIALSDYLAGNQILGALFLDEGFGTLDPQALESVAGALENLRTGGRMVGVITHIESLSERLPHHLLVSKSAAGSSVQRLE